MIVFATQTKIGKLDRGKVSWLNSQFLTFYQKNLRAIRERTAWKTQGTGAQFMGTHRPIRDEHDIYRININGLTFAAQGDIIYSISVDNGSGIFSKNPLDDQELEGHIIHKHDTEFFAVDYNPAYQQVVASVSSGLGKHLALFRDNSAVYQMLTEGDCVDQNPVWSRTRPGTIFYDSCGIGRDNNGNCVGYSNRAIYSLDLNSGQVREVVSLASCDCVSPREDNQGNIYFIKRPKPRENRSGTAVLTLLLIPVKILKAIFNWINFFTMQYSGEALTTAGANPARARQQNPKEVFIDGNLINVQKTLKQNKAQGEKNPGIVPRSWELTRLSADGDMTCIKKGVMAFDIDPDGNVIYSNGKHLIKILPGGNEEVLASIPFITWIRAQ
ncbi:MAG TPA: hypothetical protein PKL39_06405 [Bacillota bacterium]|nr:hypothetical protein [Bacillota bacterium]